MDEKIDKTMDNFISTTQRSEVGVIVPLFGYWKDVKHNPLLEENALSVVVDRIRSTNHMLRIVFVGDGDSLDMDEKNPKSTGNVLMRMAKMGNTKMLHANRHDPYPRYIETGMRYLLEDTKCAFVIVINPWVLIQYNGIDSMVERANRGDDANVICGFDVHSYIRPEEFQSFNPLEYREEWFVSFDFMCLPRHAAEMYRWDAPFKTHSYYAFDLAERMKQIGYASINYPQAPIFPFKFEWDSFENKKDRYADEQEFTKKWGFGIAEPNS